MRTLFVSDLDGTLLRGDARISENSCRIINRLTDGGLSFSYATARGWATANKAVDGLRGNTPVITKNGVLTVNPGTGGILSKNLFTEEEAGDIYRILRREEIYPIVSSYQKGKEKFSYNKHTLSPGGRWYVENHPNDERNNPLSTDDAILSGEVFYFACIGTRELLDGPYEAIRDKYLCVYSKDTYNDRMWLEIMPERATKANAVEQLKERMGFDYIVAFGDGVNDIPMFAIADECYAVENAVGELKEMATDVIGTNEEDGVANWLKDNAGRYL